MGPGRRSLLPSLLLPPLLPLLLPPMLLPSACAVGDPRPCPAAAQLGRRGGQDREPRLLKGHQRHAAVRGDGGGQGECMSSLAGGRQAGRHASWRAASADAAAAASRGTRRGPAPGGLAWLSRCPPRWPPLPGRYAKMKSADGKEVRAARRQPPAVAGSRAGPAAARPLLCRRPARLPAASPQPCPACPQPTNPLGHPPPVATPPGHRLGEHRADQRPAAGGDAPGVQAAQGRVPRPGPDRFHHGGVQQGGGELWAALQSAS